MSSAQAESAGSKRLAMFVFAGVLWLAAALVHPTLAAAPVQPNSDDGYYLRYMSEVASRGLGALPGQFDWYLANKDNYIFPPPSRVGFSVASALWSKCFGATLDGLKELSFASFLGLIAVQFFGARRRFGEWRAVAIAALTAFSPLYMGLSRLALTDEFISLAQVATIWLFFELVRAPRKWLVWSLFVVVFAFTILTKEISVLLGIPFTLFALIERFYAERDVPAGRIAAALALPVVITIGVWIAAAGGLETLTRTIEIVIGSPATNQYAIQMGSGPWYRYVVDELLVSPWPTLLGLAGVALTVWRWRENDYDATRVYLVLIYVLQIAVLSFFTKNLRYIAVLEAPLRVLAVLAVWDLCAGRRAMLARALPCAIVAVLCWLDWQNFQQVFITWQTYDPVSVQLGAARQLFPMAQPGK